MAFGGSPRRGEEKPTRRLSTETRRTKSGATPSGVERLNLRIWS